MPEPWTARQLAAVPEDTAGVHVGALFAGEFPPEAIAALAAEDRLVSLDGQGLVRVAEAGPLELRAPDDLADVLEAVDVLKLSVREAEALLGAVTRKALGRLGVPEVIVTYGERGAAVWADGRLEHVAPPLVVAREPTGAGTRSRSATSTARLDDAAPLEAAEAGAALVVDVLDAPAESR